MTPSQLKTQYIAADEVATIPVLTARSEGKANISEFVIT
jgi:hypothetical protein